MATVDLVWVTVQGINKEEIHQKAIAFLGKKAIAFLFNLKS